VALLASGADAAVLWGIRKFMGIVTGGDFPLWGWIAVMLALTLLRLMLLSLKIRISEIWVSQSSARLTAWFLHRLRILSPRIFHGPEGDRQVEAAFESTQVMQANGAVLFQALQAVLQLAVFLPVLFYISWPLTLFLFLVVVPVVSALQKRLHKLGPAEESLLRDRADFRGSLNLARRLFRQWSAPRERREISDELLRDLRGLQEKSCETSIRKSNLSLVTESVSVVAMVLVLAFCALLMGRGWMEASDLVLFCSAVLLSYKPVKECARVMPQIRQVSSAFCVLESFEKLATRKSESASFIKKCGHGGRFVYAGSERPVFEGLKLTWSREKPVLVRGRNGVGKSTLLRLLAGLELWDVTPDADFCGMGCGGRVFFVAQDLELPPREFLNRLLKNLRYLPADCRGAVLDFAEKFKLFPLVEKQGLSGGERSRVALLWALVSDCETILLDEPFASIALVDREPLLREFLHVASLENKWVVIVSHDVLSPEMESSFNVVNFVNELVDEGVVP